MAFDNKSKRKLLTLILADSFIKNNHVYMTSRFKLLLCVNRNFLDLKKASFGYYEFLVEIDDILVRLSIKVFVSQGSVQAKIAVHTL